MPTDALPPTAAPRLMNDPLDRRASAACGLWTDRTVRCRIVDLRSAARTSVKRATRDPREDQTGLWGRVRIRVSAAAQPRRTCSSFSSSVSASLVKTRSSDASSSPSEPDDIASLGFVHSHRYGIEGARLSRSMGCRSSGARHEEHEEHTALITATQTRLVRRREVVDADADAASLYGCRPLRRSTWSPQRCPHPSSRESPAQSAHAPQPPPTAA